MKTLAVFLFLVIAGCSGGGAPPGESAELPGPPAVAFAPLVDHAYLPLLPGASWTYEGVEDGAPKREEVRVLDEPHLILGIPCTAVVEDSFADGEIAETTTQWFAQDVAGNVWVFGEESLEYTGGVPVASEDSWRAGVAGKRPWIVLARDPQPGDIYAGNRGDGWDENHVLSVTAPAAVPAGAFAGCLDVEETNPDDPEDRDRILYAPGVGRVSEESAGGRVDLVGFAVR